MNETFDQITAAYNKDVTHTRHQASTKLQTLNTILEQSTDIELIELIDKQLNATIGLTKYHEQQTKPALPQVEQHPPSNKKVTRQISFFSTRKKQKTATVRIAKPTRLEKDHIKNVLQSNTVLYTDKLKAAGKYE